LPAKERSLRVKFSKGGGRLVADATLTLFCSRFGEGLNPGKWLVIDRSSSALLKMCRFATRDTPQHCRHPAHFMLREADVKGFAVAKASPAKRTRIESIGQIDHYRPTLLGLDSPLNHKKPASLSISAICRESA